MTEERKIYIEKKDIVHTPEEILAAFEDNTAIVFELSRKRTPSAKSNLFVTVRHLSQADHDTRKEAEAK